MPVFVHMPLTLRPDGKGKLSKRDGDRLGFPVFPLQWTDPETGEISTGYRESGYLPEAFVNILALLGWNPGTERELFTMDDLVREFSLERIIKSGSKFDPDKARWFNHQYIIQKSNNELAEWFSGELRKKQLNYTTDYLVKIIRLVKERIFLLPDLWKESWFFFQRPEKFDETVFQKVWNEDTHGIIGDVRIILSRMEDFSHDHIEASVRSYSEENNIGLGRIMNPLRLILVGSNQGPGLANVMEILGLEEVLGRIMVFMNWLNSISPYSEPLS
jgi:glutamyl-tRNA synthetase